MKKCVGKDARKGCKRSCNRYEKRFIFSNQICLPLFVCTSPAYVRIKLKTSSACISSNSFMYSKVWAKATLQNAQYACEWPLYVSPCSLASASARYLSNFFPLIFLRVFLKKFCPPAPSSSGFLRELLSIRFLLQLTRFWCSRSLSSLVIYMKINNTTL